MSALPSRLSAETLPDVLRALVEYVEALPEAPKTSLEIDREKTRAVMFANRAAYARARRNRRLG